MDTKIATALKIMPPAKLKSMFSSHQLINGSDRFRRARHFLKFDVGFGSRRLDKYCSEIEQGLEISPAFNGDVFDPVHAGFRHLFVKKIIKINVDDATVSYNTHIKIPI